MAQNRDKYSLGIVFVTLETKRMANEILKRVGEKSIFTFRGMSGKFRSLTRHLSDKLKRKNLSVKFREPPEPDDIIWKNLGVSRLTKLYRRMLTVVISAIALIVSFGAILGLKLFQVKILKPAVESGESNGIAYRAVSIPISLVILIINKLISYILQTLTLEEMHSTETNYFQSLALKETVLQFVNTNLLVVIVHIIVFEPRAAVYKTGALIEDACYILLAQALVTPLLSYFSFGRLLRYMAQRRLISKVKNDNADGITQEEANELFEKLEFQPEYAYSTFANAMMTGVFFQPILPIGSITSLIALVLNYYAYKKKLLRDSKRPVMVSDDISEVTLYLLNLMPLVFGISNMIFDKILLGKIRGSSTFFFIMGVVCIVYPLYLFFMNTVKDCISTSNAREINMDVDYDQMRIRFLNEYDRANPVTKEEALQEYFKFMRGKFGLM